MVKYELFFVQQLIKDVIKNKQSRQQIDTEPEMEIKPWREYYVDKIGMLVTHELKASMANDGYISNCNNIILDF